MKRYAYGSLCLMLCSCASISQPAAFKPSVVSVSWRVTCRQTERSDGRWRNSSPRMCAACETA